MEDNLFSSLTSEQKVDFFIKCQKLLIRHHSKSSFVIRANSLEKSINAFVSHVKGYKGCYYTSDNICVLYNYIFIDDTGGLDKNDALRKNAYQSPASNYNAISIDFVVFRELADSLEFVRQKDVPQIRYILFVKDGKIKLHKKEDLLNKLPLVRKDGLL